MARTRLGDTLWTTSIPHSKRPSDLGPLALAMNRRHQDLSHNALGNGSIVEPLKAVRCWSDVANRSVPKQFGGWWWYTYPRDGGRSVLRTSSFGIPETIRNRNLLRACQSLQTSQECGNLRFLSLAGNYFKAMREVREGWLAQTCTDYTATLPEDPF